MAYLRDHLLTPSATGDRAASALVAALPAYQIALWPDGWELSADGEVAVRDTHAMAEARRWYALAERNRSREDAGRAMALHGIFVPRTIVDMVDHRFPSEEAASVAMHLVAGDWIRRRRRQLLLAPADALAERSLAWCGSRHTAALEEHEVLRLLRDLLDICIAERAIPDAIYRLDVRREDGYGIRCHCCRVHVWLDSYARSRVQETLTAALTPWNRAVPRHGTPAKVLSVEVLSGARRRSWR